MIGGEFGRPYDAHERPPQIQALPEPRVLEGNHQLLDVLG